MTNFERCRNNLTYADIAYKNIRTVKNIILDNMENVIEENKYQTSDGNEFNNDEFGYELAVSHEINWLKQEEIPLNDRTISIEEWEKAIKYLNEIIDEYKKLNNKGTFGLEMTLKPLLIRIKYGERTEELYNEIMTCE